MNLVTALLRNAQKLSRRTYKTAALLSQQRPGEQRQKLLTRFACYIDSEYNRKVGRKDLVQPKRRGLNLERDRIRHFTDEELQAALSDLKEQKSLWKPHEFRSAMDAIDRECTSRLDCLDSATVLGILNSLAQIGVDAVTNYRFYEFGIDNLVKNLQFLNRQELLQTMFYVGLKKKNKEAQGILRKCLKELQKYDVDRLSVEELCIVCDATFKTSTKIASKRMLDKVHRTLNDNLRILHDPALFVALIKTIRHNRDQDDDILSTIACTILFNQTYRVYSFMAMCHVLALFADYAYHDEALLDLLASSCLKEIEPLADRPWLIRNKDLTRFLWALSALNFCERTEFLDVIVPIIERKVQMGSYKSDIEELVEVILYLWMLNRQPVDLIKYALTPENISYIKAQKSRTKLRLNLLLSCVYFENRPLFKGLNVAGEPFRPYHTKLQLERRPGVARVLDALRRASHGAPVNRFEVTYEVPHLEICGLTGYRSNVYKAVYVEVLDESVCVRNREPPWPIGPMFLKLRILKGFDEALVLVDEDMAKNSTDEELRDYLIQEIQLLC